MREQRTAASTAQDEDAAGPVAVQVRPRVELQPVVGTISAPIFNESDPTADEPDVGASNTIAAPAVDIPWPDLRRPSVRHADVAFPFLVAATVALATSDAGVGALSGLLLSVGWWLRSLSRRASFSFGEGFVGYRSDMGWPLGVQEDDDFRWNWRVHRVPADDDDLAGDAISRG
jgi:hypothetical protein